MKVKDNTLVCKAIKFYCKGDKDFFLKWVTRIDCIDEIVGKGEDIYLHICADVIHDYSLDDLIGIFYRYKIDMKQLAQFLTEDNKEWFYDNKIAFWHKKVFGK